MGVIDGQWWGLWWPWLLVWAATAACFGIVLGFGWRRLRSRRGPGGGTHLDMCFYLHKQQVMDIYEVGGFTKSLTQEVADRLQVTNDYGLRGRLFFWMGRANRGVTKERVTTYLQESTPMNVIGVLMDAMRKEDKVVDVDLVDGELEVNQEFTERLGGRYPDGQVPLSALRRLEAYVSVSGDFTAARLPNGDVQLRARYGTGEPAAHVEIICDETEGRGDFRKERYYRGKKIAARCLGRVQGWDEQTGELTLDPLAIFQ
ncbi:hypothetical protein I2W78_28385 [Streptomyces spinoverrucosus]|uniref:hypothetical protein n=1 Tax=Streptomyces spinoverrucosus TaxID=284043 RepID=UPI0018C35510|nr:hypothetical protein [Streptomyces spinoverrucosus]MBG0855659.1 hypothetical protein [Streptomyces spinoverrucosus]